MGVLGLKKVSSPLPQFLICRTAVLLHLHQFWNTVRRELANKSPYIASIGDMRMRLVELRDDDKEAKKLSSEGLSEDRKDIK